LLGPVHRGVGARDQVRPAAAMLGVERDADARRDDELRLT